jgi:hypothetical protein
MITEISKTFSLLKVEKIALIFVYKCNEEQWFVNYDYNEFELSLLHTIIRSKVPI